MAFCESGDETEVWVPFCEGAVLLLEEESLPEAVTEADGRAGGGEEAPRVVPGMDVPVAPAVSVRAAPKETAASEENGQWKGMEEEGSVTDEVGPGPW